MIADIRIQVVVCKDIIRHMKEAQDQYERFKTIDEDRMQRARDSFYEERKKLEEVLPTFKQADPVTYEKYLRYSLMEIDSFKE